MQDIFTTQNLTLSLLSLADVEFMYDLVNTPHWIEFIGNRYINNLEDATAYVTRIINSPNIHYWVVKLNRENKALGVITFIKRDNLDYPDIGFAFLPGYEGKGFAYEGALEILNAQLGLPEQERILATTLKDNVRSIRLLERLGFKFDREIVSDEETLQVYAIDQH